MKDSKSHHRNLILTTTLVLLLLIAGYRFSALMIEWHQQDAVQSVRSSGPHRIELPAGKHFDVKIMPAESEDKHFFLHDFHGLHKLHEEKMSAPPPPGVKP